MIKDFSGNKITPKQRAQEEILSMIGKAWASVENDPDMTEREREQVLDQMSKQYARIEKLFGYEPFSWMRGY